MFKLQLVADFVASVIERCGHAMLWYAVISDRRKITTIFFRPLMTMANLLFSLMYIVKLCGTACEEDKKIYKRRYKTRLRDIIETISLKVIRRPLLRMTAKWY